MLNQDKVTLVCTSLNPNHALLSKMIDSAKEFHEIVIHEDKDSITHYSRFYDGTAVRHVYNPEHLSIEKAYNWIIKNYVKTEWVCCFSDDDYFYLDGLYKILNEIRIGNARDCEIAHFKFHISGYVHPEDVRCWFGKKEYDLCERGRITPKYFDKHNRLPAGSFFRKSAWEKVNGFQGDKFHDWDLWKRMAQSGCTFKYFDHLVYNMVRRENSAWCKQAKG